MPEILHLNQRHTFRAEAPEFVVETPQLGLEDLKDIRVSIAAVMDIPRGGLVSSPGLEDVRIYFDGKDITSAFIGQIRMQLQQTAASRKQYERAADNWVAALIASKELSSDEVVALKVIAKNLKVASWSTLAKLSNAKEFGRYGGLNPFFFFGAYIQTPDVALSSIIPTTQEGGIDLDQVQDWRLIVSQGPSRALTNAGPTWNSANQATVTCQLTFLYEDAWRRELLARLDGIGDDLRTLADRTTELVADVQTCLDQMTAIKSLEVTLSAALSTLAELLKPPKPPGP